MRAPTNRTRATQRLTAVAAAFCVLAAASAAQSQESRAAARPEPVEKVAVTVTAIAGSVEVQQPGQSAWEPVLAGAELFEGTTLRTRDGGNALLSAGSGTARIYENSTARITRSERAGRAFTALLSLEGGSVQAKGGPDMDFRVRTQHHSVQVGGAQAVVSFAVGVGNGDTTHFSAIAVDGAVAIRFENARGMLTRLRAGVRLRDMVNTGIVRTGPNALQALHRVLFEPAEVTSPLDVPGRGLDPITTHIGGNRHLLQMPGMTPPMNLVADYFDIWQTETGAIALRQTGTEPLRVESNGVMAWTTQPGEVMFLSSSPDGALLVTAAPGNRGRIGMGAASPTPVGGGGIETPGADGWPLAGVPREGTGTGGGEPAGSMEIPPGQSATVAPDGTMAPSEGSTILGGTGPSAPVLRGPTSGAGTIGGPDEGFDDPDSDWGDIQDIDDPSELSPVTPP